MWGEDRAAEARAERFPGGGGVGNVAEEEGGRKDVDEIGGSAWKSARAWGGGGKGEGDREARLEKKVRKAVPLREAVMAMFDLRVCGGGGS